MPVISVQIHRTVPADPERVWRALTDPAAVAAWFWPKHFHTTVAMDPRPGGTYRIAAPSAPGGGIAVTGEYAVVQPPNRLVFTWRWDGQDDETLVTIELSRVDGGTKLIVVHEGFGDEKDRDNHDTGWTDCLDRLPAFVAGADAPG